MCTELQTNTKGNISFDACIAYLETQRQVNMYLSAVQVTFTPKPVYNFINIVFLKQVQRIDTQLMKLGLRGTTVLTAAGDGGEKNNLLTTTHIDTHFFQEAISPSSLSLTTPLALC